MIVYVCGGTIGPMMAAHRKLRNNEILWGSDLQVLSGRMHVYLQVLTCMIVYLHCVIYRKIFRRYEISKSSQISRKRDN